MSKVEYRYSPELPKEFHCRVPLPGVFQAVVHNGELSNEPLGNNGVTLSSGEGGLGYNIEATPNSDSNETIQIVSFRDSNDTSDLEYSNKIEVRSNSNLNLLLCSHTLSMDSFKTSEAIKIVVEEGAKANLVVMQNEHNHSSHNFLFDAEIAAFGHLTINVVILHGAQLDNRYQISLNGSSSSCALNGVYLADGTQKINNNVTINHMVPNCVSSQLFKGILDDSAVATFTGRIVVAKDAQQTEAFQENHNLLISSKAKVYAQPQLEIYADDVKCSHGATSGSLDEEALFYMRSRGIGAEEAKLQQQLAFVNDVLEKIPNENQRERLRNLVDARLRGEFGKCDNCSMMNCC